MPPQTIYIDPTSGNLGIGTSIPLQPLHVQGNIYSSCNISAGNLGMFRNRIINGDMSIDQRNAGAAVTGVNVFPLDRFQISKSGTLTVTGQQVAPPATLTGFQKCLKFSVGTQQTSLTASDFGTFYQRIEGFNISDLMWGTSSAQSVTVSFWIYASNTGTFSIALRNGAFTRSYVTNYTVTSANTWQYVTATIPGDTTGTWSVINTTGIDIALCFGTGSTYQTTADAWQAGVYLGTSSTTNFFANSVGAAVYITGLQLEKGTMATPFEFRPYGVNLQLCQRYFQQLNPTVASSSSPDYYFSSTTGAALETRHPLPVAMCATPTPSTVTTSGTASYTTYVQALRLVVDARSTTSSIQFKTLSSEL